MWRRGYGCDCKGPPDDGPAHRGAFMAMDAIRRITGVAPHGCPWRAFTHPTVVEVLDLYDAASTDGGVDLSVVLAIDPPHHLWEGVRLWHRMLGRVREALRESKPKR